MIDPAVFIGKPLMFKNQIEIFPPTVGQVIALPQYVQFCKILTISQEDIIDDLAKRKIDIEAPTPFEFLLIN